MRSRSGLIIWIAAVLFLMIVFLAGCSRQATTIKQVVLRESIRRVLSETDRTVLITTRAKRGAGVGTGALVRQELAACGLVPVGDVVRKTDGALFAYGCGNNCGATPPHMLEVEINFWHIRDTGYGLSSGGSWTGEATLFSVAGKRVVETGRAKSAYHLSDNWPIALEIVARATIRSLCYEREIGGLGLRTEDDRVISIDHGPGVVRESTTTIAPPVIRNRPPPQSGGARLQRSGTEYRGGKIVPIR